MKLEHYCREICSNLFENFQVSDFGRIFANVFMAVKNQNKCIQPLNLPVRELPLRYAANGLIEIFDTIRKKWIVLTPEEWVRQHFVAHLVGDMGYPASLIGNEISINLNGLYRRCDSVVWRASDATPLMIIEYKSPSVKLTRMVFDQIVRYNMVFKAPYLIISNGVKHFCFQVDCETGASTVLPEIPRYSNL